MLVLGRFFNLGSGTECNLPYDAVQIAPWDGFFLLPGILLASWPHKLLVSLVWASCGCGYGLCIFLRPFCTGIVVFIASQTLLLLLLLFCIFATISSKSRLYCPCAASAVDVYCLEEVVLRSLPCNSFCYCCLLCLSATFPEAAYCRMCSLCSFSINLYFLFCNHNLMCPAGSLRDTTGTANGVLCCCRSNALLSGVHSLVQIALSLAAIHLKERSQAFLISGMMSVGWNFIMLWFSNTWCLNFVSAIL